mgnify:CR=1 FL=1
MGGAQDVGFFDVQKLVGHPVQRTSNMWAFIEVALYLVISTNDKHGKTLFAFAKYKSLAANGRNFLQGTKFCSRFRVVQRCGG